MGKASRRKVTPPPPSTPPPATVTAPTRAIDWKQSALICGALLVLVLLVFGRSYWNGFIDFDDPEYVAKNAVVQRGLTAEGVRYAFTSIRPYYFQPLIWL